MFYQKQGVVASIEYKFDNSSSLLRRICVGLPANVSWDELLRERPYDVMYLRKLLDCTRALNSEYNRRRRGRKPVEGNPCLLYTSPSPRDRTRSRMPSSA